MNKDVDVIADLAGFREQRWHNERRRISPHEAHYSGPERRQLPRRKIDRRLGVGARNSSSHSHGHHKPQSSSHPKQ